MKEKTFAENVIDFNRHLSKVKIHLPSSFELVNPFAGDNVEKVEIVYKTFYKKFYNDNNKRIMILGSSPARRGTAITGVPYEDAKHLYYQTGIQIEGFSINKSSSNFLYDVIERYGGCEKFYSNFYMNFVCPLGIVRTNDKGNQVNCNYYDDKMLKNTLFDFILSSLKIQRSFNIDHSICYSLGSGENFKYLTNINNKYKFFKQIIPLEHPRFIMQYNSKDKEKYIDKYLQMLNKKIIMN